jgi:membrane protease YdiL (CAAX protease family)
MQSISRKDMLLLAVGFESALLLLAIGLGWLVRAHLLRQINVNWSAFLLGVAATVPLLAGAWWSSETHWAPIARLRKDVARSVVPLFAQCSVLDFVVIALLAGLAEEALFRGVLQTALAGIVSPLTALVIASAAFGLAHLVTPAYAFIAGLIGLYLGLLHLISQNLFIPIVVHALYDFAALTYLLQAKQFATGDELSSG